MVAATLRAAAWVSVIGLYTVVQAGSAWAGGVGVVGDSYSDEYEFYPPDRSRARNWVEFLASTRGLDFGTRSTASRGEPRNQGFAFNWARSGATTSDLANTGQVSGVVEQVSRGDVDMVVMFIGGNDYLNALEAPDPIQALRIAGPRAIENLRRAAETILAANEDVRLVLITVPDLRDLPDIRQALREGRLSDSVLKSASRGVGEFNAAIRQFGRARPRVAVADFDLQSRVAKALAGDIVPVDGHRIFRGASGDEPTNFFLADRRHAGTIGQALLARLIVDTINARFQATIPRIGEREILSFADSVGTDREVVRVEQTVEVPARP